MFNVMVGLAFVLMGTQSVAADTKEPFKEPATGIVFPAMLGKWTRGQDRSFGSGLGVSIPYNSEEGVVATIFVYNLNQKEIASGPSSKAVKDQYEQAKKEVAKAQEQRGATAKMGTEDEISFGTGKDALKALHAVFAITEKDNNELISHVYLTGYKNQFFKIRITYAKKNEKASEAAVDKLLSELGALLK